MKRPRVFLGSFQVHKAPKSSRLFNVLQKKQELQQIFEASDYVKAGRAEEQVYDRLMWIKENLYPEGTEACICGIGAAEIRSALYGSDDDCVIGVDDHWNWYRVDGSVHNLAFSPYNVSLKDIVMVDDTLYTAESRKPGHVQIVLTHDERGITVVESNLGGDKEMQWGRRISWKEFADRESPYLWEAATYVTSLRIVAQGGGIDGSNPYRLGCRVQTLRTSGTTDFRPRMVSEPQCFM